MAKVDIDRASKLDKIHIQRMLHAHGQLLLELIALQDGHVNAILNKYQIVLYPGPHAGLEYPAQAKQILELALHSEKIQLAAAEAKKSKPKNKSRSK